MEDIKKCEERLQRINNRFNNVFYKILEGNYSRETSDCFNERLALYELYIKANINLKHNKIIESNVTKYDIDSRTLYVNKEDILEYVDYVIMQAIIERLFDKVEIKNVKIKFYALYFIFYTLGLVKISTDKLLNGSDHVIILNFTRAVLASME